MAKLKPEVVTREANFDVLNVPLFEVTGKKEKNFIMTEENVDAFIAMHNKMKEEKEFLPTVFIGHNGNRDEQPALWFFDNIRRIGKQVYVDFVNMKSWAKYTMDSFPYRSMEIIWDQITGIALLGSNTPYFASAPLVVPYSKTDKDEIQRYLLPDVLPEENPEENIDKEKPLISSQFHGMTKTPEEIAAEATAQAAKFQKEADDAKAETANFKKEADEAKAEVARLNGEAAQKAVFAKATESLSQYSKKGKVRFSKKEDEEAAIKFAAGLPDEAARTAFYDILKNLIAFDGNEEEEEGDEAPEGGEDPAPKEGDEPTTAQMKKAEEMADKFMADGVYKERHLALSAAFEKLGMAK